MKNTKFYSALLFLFVFFVVWTCLVRANPQDTPLSIKVRTIKPTFTLGEIVNLDILVQNIGNKDFVVASNAIEAGTVKVFISKNGAKFRKYTFGGKVGGDNSILKPGETNVFQKTVIYSGAPNYSHLNKDAAKAADEQDNRILTDYAFPEAGNYSIKVVLYYRSMEGVKNIYEPDNTVESAPIQITIIEPVGEDKEVWNYIKDIPNFAFLMEFNEFPYYAPERIKFQQNLEYVISRYPNSFIVRQLKQSVEKFNQNEARRNDPRNRIIRQPNRPDPQ